MDERDLLARKFEEKRAHLRGLAYRMLGSLAEADDAVQEAWLRLQRSDAGTVENLGGWLTTVVSRVCLDMLRSRKSRREEALGVRVPDPIVSPEGAEEAMLADSIGLALLVVLETLAPAERLAFVLHDMFGLPFEEIAPIVDRTPTAARQLASRARRRVQGAATPDRDRLRQRQVVDAFLAASRSSLLYSKNAPAGRREVYATVNGGPGLVVFVDGAPFSVLGFTIAGDKIVEIDIVADPARVQRLDLGGVAP